MFGMIIVFAVVSLPVILIFWRLWNSKYISTVDRIPGPKPIPILGNALQFGDGPAETYRFFLKCAQENPGGINRVWMAYRPLVSIYKAEYLEPILGGTTVANIKKSTSLYQPLVPWLGDGLLTSYGTKWQMRRKMITPTFHYSILESFMEIFDTECQKLVRLLQKKVDGPKFEMHSYITNCALDIICEAAMGVTVNAQEDSEETYAAALFRISELIMLRIKNPFYFNDFIFSLSALGRDHDKTLKVLHDFTMKVILERKAEFDAADGIGGGQVEKGSSGIGLKKRYAFLDMLLANAKADNSLTMIDIQEEVDTFMFEGHDTTASATTIAIYCLATNPEFQIKLRDEIMTVMPDESQPITTAAINELKYMDCFMKECQRFCPNVPMYGRELMEDTKIGGYEVPKGTTIIILSAPLHRNPEYFSNPDIFDPDRWANEKMTGRHPFSYIPFSAGTRNCIGQKFAQLEEKVMLSRLLRAYNFSCSQTWEDFNPELTLVLRPGNGLMVKITRI